MVPARDSLAASVPSGQIPAGSTIAARFRIDGPLLQDAVSQTYRATDLGHSTSVALRVVPLRLLGAQAAQLEADVEKASAIVHKNLVEVLMVGREADFYFIATELLDGQTLRDFIDGKRNEGRGVSFRGACNLVTHITNALEKAATFMPHGGLNPASVWVNKAGRVKVADLGLPRTLPPLARRGAAPGTPDAIYVAPEVMAGAPPSAAADVYALGVILYEVLTGRAPSAPLRPASEQSADAPVGIDAIIERATQRNPGARFASVAELRQALTNLTTLGTGAPESAAPAGIRAPTPAVAAPVAAAHQAGADGRLTLGKSFNVAEAAGSAADDTQERWLIQKDKLDFGPFSLAQIRAQIERGEILGDHMIVDSDTGDRKKVKDYPSLKEFTKVSERRLEQARRARDEHSHEKTEKKKSMVTILIAGAALAVVVGGVALYVMSRKAADTTTLATREEEAEVDLFLKEVKVSFATAHVAKRGSHHGGGSAGGADDFNNDMNLGDVTRAGGGDDTLDDGVIQKVMMGNYRSLIPCIMAEKKHTPGLSDINIDFVVKGSGKVSAVKVNGQRGGGFPSCVLGRMQSFNFPHFNGSKTIASWSMSMR